MTERERLIEILSVPIYPRIDADPAEVVADYLLDNGVIVPPVKVGDTVYHASPKHGVAPATVKHVLCGEYSRKGTCRTLISDNLLYYYESDCIGRDVFLSEEEAEAALKEREKYV